jgi:D-alanyl-D-alanine dipeptidase
MRHIGVALVMMAVAAGGAADAHAARRGTLDVKQRFDYSGGVYVEGSVSYLRVRKWRRVLVERSRAGPVRVEKRLRPGLYRVASYQRPCAGNCTFLDMPTDRCSRRVRVFAGETTAARIVTRPGRGCRVRVREPKAVPATARIRAARRWVRSRTGASFALIDSHGRLHGFAPRRRYVTASVVKAMLLVAYLRRLGRRLPSANERAVLGRMIRWSSNNDADTVYGWVGDGGLLDLARRARMRDLTVAGHWGGVYFSAADQARFFRRLRSLLPRGSRDYALRLLSSIVPAQRWGFSRFSGRAGWSTYFKGGWRRTALGSLVHEAALFERDGRSFSLAVLSDGNPSHDYGTATLRGVARRLFRPRPRSASAPDEAGSRAHRRAGLVDVHRFGPGILLDIGYAGSDNITGRRLPGYCREWALMLEPAARALGRVQRYLRRRNRGLLILDAYRPARGTRALVRWAERTGRGHLVGTYIARRSRHNLGSAVDLMLVRASDGQRLRMGRYDALGPGAHTLDASGRVLRNRLGLKSAMERFGFTNYWREWWHFEHRVTGTTYLDLPLGCGGPR